MIASLWANSNYDDTDKQKGVRQQAIEEIENNFSEAISIARKGMGKEQEQDEIDYDNPFFKSVKNTQPNLEQPGVTRNTRVSEIIDPQDLASLDQ